MNTLNRNSKPIFIVCIARSGSTLLRYILDTHESIACPPELNICRLVERVKGILGQLGDDEKSILIDTQKYVDQLVRSRLKKDVWCEKSVVTTFHLPLMTDVFPGSRYVLLVRHCMDFLYSALELTKYDYSLLGLHQCILDGMDNTVDAIAKFWCENTERVLAFEKSDYSPVFRIRYEDILSDTDRTLGDLFEFLELDFDVSLIDNIFSDKKKGAGDPKIMFTDKIITNNSGKGRAIPVAMIEEETLERMNHLLLELKYETVDQSWGQ